jgi:hypothetical protein
MSPGAVSLTMILAIVALGATIGFLAGVRKKMNLEQWTVGGRRFGTVLMFLLMAGEIYTTFSFLGASGWAPCLLEVEQVHVGPRGTDDSRCPFLERPGPSVTAGPTHITGTLATVPAQQFHHARVCRCQSDSRGARRNRSGRRGS